MGCGEGELEKKARRGLKWGCIIGAVVLATAANGFYAGARYKAGVEEGHKAGVAEAQEEAPKLTIELMSSLNPYQRDTRFSVMQNRGGRIILYHLATDQNAAFADDGTLISPITEVGESVSITDNEGTDMEYRDIDTWYDIGNPVRKSCRGKHDGLVDFVINHAVSSMDTDRYLLCRDQNYEANRAAFDEADRIFNEVRGQFFPSE